MKITLINHSDTRGGASVVSYRLMEAMCRLGADARMVVMHKGTADARVACAGDSLRARASFLAEHAENMVRDGFERANIFKISTARYGMPLHSHPWVREADAICLNWVNQGMLSLNEIKRICNLGKPVAWTMHDMWNMTGVCHHAGECHRYTGTCGNCPLLWNGRHATDLSTSVQRRKASLYSSTGIRFVAVSNWLARKARESSLMRDADLTVISNAFPVDDFPCRPTLSRATLGLPDDGPLVVMGAARLDDPIKNFPLAIDTLNALPPALGVKAVFFGEIRDRALLSRLHVPYVHLGTVSDKERLAQIYAHAAIVLSTSRYETLPGTLVEGISAGAMAVTTGNGGQSDIVTEGVTGFIAPEEDAHTLAVLLTRAIHNPAPRQGLHAAMAAKFSAGAVARRYLELLSRK